MEVKNLDLLFTDESTIELKHVFVPCEEVSSFV